MNLSLTDRRQPLFKAQEFRSELGLGTSVPISAVEASLRLGIQVQIRSLPSVEGLYSRSNPGPLIILGNQRSIGRQSFNCAHELGHHAFGHQSAVDPRTENREAQTPEERMANAFASHFLMPQVGIMKAFKARGLNPKAPEPLDVYRVANYFEVGYGTLANHLHYTMKEIQRDRLEELLKVQPKHIRQQFVRSDEICELIIVDEHWTERPIDLRVGDYILAPSQSKFEGVGLSLEHEGPEGMIFVAKKQSVGRLVNERLEWAQFVRASNRLFDGLADYRHLERDEDENDL